MKAIAGGKAPAFRLRLPQEVMKAITDRAKANGRSRNSEVVVVLARAVGLGEDIEQSRNETG